MYSVFIRGVYIGFGRRDCYFDCVVAFGGFDFAEVRADFVVAFRAP
jgi:hypothetical protein